MNIGEKKIENTYRPFVGPSLTENVILDRMSTNGVANATFLSPGNLLTASESKFGIEQLRKYFHQDWETQSGLLAQVVFDLVGCSPETYEAIMRTPRHLMTSGRTQVVSYWNGVNWVYGSIALTPAWLTAYAIDRLKVGPGASVLVFGFGTGYLSSAMARAVGENGRVVAVEIDKKLVDKGKELIDAIGLKSLEIVHADALDPPIEDKFDALWPTLSVEAIPEAWLARVSSTGRIAAFLPLSREEFDEAQANSSWWESKVSSYDEYIAGRWWDNLKLVVSKAEQSNGGFAEDETIYDLFNPPMIGCDLPRSINSAEEASTIQQASVELKIAQAIGHAET